MGSNTKLKKIENGQFVTGYIVDNRNTELGKYSGLYWNGSIYILLIKERIKTYKCIPVRRMKKYFAYAEITLPAKCGFHAKNFEYREYLPIISNVPKFVRCLEKRFDYFADQGRKFKYKFRIEKI
jgi:hypothetical protein